MLRERLGLPGAKNACEQGECGSCSVYLDGTLVCACLVLAAQADGRDGRHRRGARRADEASCTRSSRRSSTPARCSAASARPAWSSPSHDLLARDPQPSDAEIREALAGNMCRCTGYAKIIDAVQLAAERLAGEAGMTRARRRAASARSPAGSAPARSAPTGSRRCAASSPTRRTCTSRGCCGARRCARPHPRARIRVARHERRRRGRPASTPCSPPPTCPAGRPTASSTPTSRCSPGATCASWASRSRSSPPTTPRRRAAPPTRSASSTRCSTPLTDAEAAMRPDAPPLHAGGNVLRHLRDRARRPRGRRARRGRGRVRGRHAGPGVPRPRVRASRCPTATAASSCTSPTQWLHVDRDQVAACLGLPPERVRLSLGGVGGAFGAREDITMQVHACLLALRTGGR